MNEPDEPPVDPLREQRRLRLRQLILMRETGPKRPSWHEARMRLIWRLHEQIDEAELRIENEELRTKNQEPQNHRTKNNGTMKDEG